MDTWGIRQSVQQMPVLSRWSSEHGDRNMVGCRLWDQTARLPPTTAHLSDVGQAVTRLCAWKMQVTMQLTS